VSSGSVEPLSAEYRRPTREISVFRKTAGVAVAALLAGGGVASAATGSLTDPKGDFPDIVKLSYSNGASKVTMAMTYAGARPQNESFYLKWGTSGARYQVFSSPSASMRELRYYRAANASPKRIACGGLRVTQPSAKSTKVVIPRGCLTKAADKLRFQGIATVGVMSSDQTRVSKAVARG
jgi:hypothetical protein